MNHTLSILGSTGSIGKNVLDVVRRYPGRFRVVGLAAGRNVELLAAQAREFAPEWVSVGDPDRVSALRELLPSRYRDRVLCGEEGNCALAALPEITMVVSALVGSVGLLPALAALEAGKRLGLANKETLVMAGRLVMETARRHQAPLVPIDSEHSAIFQALEAGRREDVSRLILTASGGPFRTWDAHLLADVRPQQALAHPNWSMGRKISIDSATLMNKGLEVIEARWLFAMPPEQIEVVVHPQSIIHSLVEYRDGSVIAQLGLPDMRIPIAYALTCPERLDLDLPRLSLSQCGALSFEAVDHQRFPALRLAYAVLEEGGVKPAIFNAANEVAVEAFLDGRIRFTRIVEVVAETLDASITGDENDINAILAADQEARRVAAALVAS
ncbi:MAG: 1-deoxy-D-xylulose-5-phosphate reductoisomerase [Desulfobulbus sp.]